MVGFLSTDVEPILTLRAVWIVSNEQLLDWVRHPVPNSQLGTVASLKCNTPQVDASEKVCNGIPQNQNGLLSRCDFKDFPFYTCVSIMICVLKGTYWYIFLNTFLSMDAHLSNRLHQCLIRRNN
jgi:hypothetical protein